MITIQSPGFGQGEVCRMILDALPDWFGRPDVNQEYTEFVHTHPT
jgi:hypothetical protein